jgi:hypothetical protein
LWLSELLGLSERLLLGKLGAPTEALLLGWLSLLLHLLLLLLLLLFLESG